MAIDTRLRLGIGFIMSSLVQGLRHIALNTDLSGQRVPTTFIELGFAIAQPNLRTKASGCGSASNIGLANGFRGL